MILHSVTLENKGLTLRSAAPDGGAGRALYANYLWLRDNCPSSFDAAIGDRQYDIVADTTEIRAREARVEGDELVIVWAGDGHVSRFDAGWLLRWLDRPGHPDPARIDRRLWTAESLGAVTRFPFAAVSAGGEAARGYLETLLRDGIALVEGVPDSEDGVRQVAEIAGHVRATFSGHYFDVKTYPKPVGTAYTAQALEPHTDSPCEAHPGWLQYLHCRVNDATGGETTFVDGAAVAADLRAAHPRDFDLLASVSIPFRFAHDAFDMRARQTVIVLDAEGAVEGLTISQHMADLFDLDQRLLDDYYPAFRRFGAMLRDPKYVIPIRLAAGQCVVFDNQRIVHGRTAYDPTSGARLFRGCYTDRGELRSRYRVLARAAAAAERMEELA